MTKEIASTAQETEPLSLNGADFVPQNSQYHIPHYSQAIKLRIKRAYEQRDGGIARGGNDGDTIQKSGQNISCECEAPTFNDTLVSLDQCHD